MNTGPAMHVRARAQADACIFDVLVCDEGRFVVMLHEGKVNSAEGLRWIGSSQGSRAQWSQRFGSVIRSGLAYNVPPRWAKALHSEMLFIG